MVATGLWLKKLTRPRLLPISKVPLQLSCAGTDRKPYARFLIDEGGLKERRLALKVLCS
jgi:hypothetical protein